VIPALLLKSSSNGKGRSCSGPAFLREYRKHSSLLALAGDVQCAHTRGLEAIRAVADGQPRGESHTNAIERIAVNIATIHMRLFRRKDLC
jgi:hypothetical protein